MWHRLYVEGRPLEWCRGDAQCTHMATRPIASHWGRCEILANQRRDLWLRFFEPAGSEIARRPRIAGRPIGAPRTGAAHAVLLLDGRALWCARGRTEHRGEAHRLPATPPAVLAGRIQTSATHKRVTCPRIQHGRRASGRRQLGSQARMRKQGTQTMLNHQGVWVWTGKGSRRAAVHGPTTTGPKRARLGAADSAFAGKLPAWANRVCNQVCLCGAPCAFTQHWS